MKLKYVCIPRGIGAYSAAGPVSGNVPPIVSDVLVTPGVAPGALDVFVAPTAVEPVTAMASATAKPTNTVFFIPFLSSSLEPLASN
jgi:hypothetical protein